MDFEEFLMNRLDLTKYIATESPKARFAESVVMDVADPMVPGNIDFRYRDDWLAFTPVRRRLLKTPVRYIRLTNSGGKICENRDSCIARIKRLQEKQVIEEGLEDILYNFLVDHEGRVYEGRGWHVRAEGPPKHQLLEHNCVDICVLGNWKREPLPDATIKAVGDLIKYGVESNFIKEYYVIIGCKDHNEVQEEMKRREKRPKSRIRKKEQKTRLY